MRKRELGYNLVEVLLAMALLGVVVLSISTLFFMGRANVYSGKQMTSAVAVGTRVMEDFSVLSLQDTVDFFGLSGKTPAALTVGGTSYTGYKITTDPMTTLTNANGTSLMTNWNALLTTHKFTDPKLTLVFEPFTGSVATNNFGTANLIKIRAVVEWNESARARKLVLDTVKTDRSK